MDDFTGRYGLALGVIAAGVTAISGLHSAISLDLAIVVGGPIIILGGWIGWYTYGVEDQAYCRHWDDEFKDRYRPAVRRLRSVLGPAHARGEDASGERWNDLKSLASDGSSALRYLIISLGPDDRDDVYEAASEISYVYREYGRLIGSLRTHRRFERWFRTAWHDHDEILRLWICIELIRSPAADFAVQRPLLEYRHIAPQWIDHVRAEYTKPLLALNVATPPTFTERLRIAQCMDRQRAVEALPHLSEQEKRVARSLLPSGRLVEIHEDQAIRGLREYDIVWCQPYNGDKRTNVYRIKEDLKEDVVRILGAPPN